MIFHSRSSILRDRENKRRREDLRSFERPCITYEVFIKVSFPYNPINFKFIVETEYIRFE